MRPTRRRIVQSVGVGVALGLAGCLGIDGEHSDDQQASTADWQEAVLRDSTIDEEFRIADFDRPTLIHLFAAYCLTCASQQQAFRKLRDQREGIEIVELSIDPNDTPEDIAAHAEASGLTWRVGVAPEAVMRNLIEEFGQSVSISAQSPVIIVCPGGRTETLSKVADPDEIERTIEETCSL